MKDRNRKELHYGDLVVVIGNKRHNGAGAALWPEDLALIPPDSNTNFGHYFHPFALAEYVATGQFKAGHDISQGEIPEPKEGEELGGLTQYLGPQQVVKIGRVE